MNCHPKPRSDLWHNTCFNWTYTNSTLHCFVFFWKYYIPLPYNVHRLSPAIMSSRLSAFIHKIITITSHAYLSFFLLFHILSNRCSILYFLWYRRQYRCRISIHIPWYINSNSMLISMVGYFFLYILWWIMLYRKA